MSQFSELLSNYVHSRNIKVYSLAQYCDLDRANMYKFINGKRTPSSLDLIEKISNFMQLTPDEKNTFIESWHITQLGADTYYRRKNVAAFFRSFNLPNTDLSLLQNHQLPVELNDKAVILNDMNEVNHTLTSIISSEFDKENGHIQLLIQPDFDFLSNILSIGWQNPSVSVEQIICLNSRSNTSAEQSTYNIHCLQKILPLYGLAFQYHCLYYYDNVTSRFGSLTLFPYMILTSEFTCLLTSDLQKGYLINSVHDCKIFQDMFESYKKSALPLIKPIDNLFFQLQVYDPDIPVHSLQLTPCLTPYLTPELMEHYITPLLPGRTQFIQYMANYVEQYFVNTLLNVDTVFSISGLRYFMNTGIINEYPREIYTPLALPDRIYMLKQLIQSFERFHYRIIKNDFCSLENELHLTINSRMGFLMFTTPRDHKLIYLEINEPGFIFTFLDYYESLDPDSFYTTAEALQILKNILNEYT